MDTVVLTIPADWLEGISLSQEELRQALKLGLRQLQQQPDTSHVIQTFLNTGRVSHLALIHNTDLTDDRQPPPTLPGPPVSEILIAQRQGEL